MNRRLLSVAIWVPVALLLMVLSTRFQLPGMNPARPSAPQDLSHWLSLLISWWPFFFLVGVWLFLTWWMRPGGPGGSAKAAAPTAAMLDDPAYWRGRADAARALSQRLADLQSKRQTLEIARGYAYLAQRAEERRRGPEAPA